MNPIAPLRRGLLAATAAAALCAGLLHAPLALARKGAAAHLDAGRADDWHGKMWTVFKTASTRARRASSTSRSTSTPRCSSRAPSRPRWPRQPRAVVDLGLRHCQAGAEFSIFTAGYIIRDPQHQQKVFAGPIGQEMFKLASDKMEVTLLTPIYLGTRQVNLREQRNVRTPAD